MSTTEKALLASGCFWGTEYYLARLPGVLSTRVGYTGGSASSSQFDSSSQKRGYGLIWPEEFPVGFTGWTRAVSWSSASTSAGGMRRVRRGER